MQTEERTHFNFTPQVAAIIALTIFALFIPLLGVALFMRDIIGKPKNEAVVTVVDEQATEPLKQALESISSQNLAPQSLSSADVSITIHAANPAEVQKKLEGLAQNEGAVVLPSFTDAQEEARLLIQLPESRAGAFISACKDMDQRAQAVSPVVGARVLSDSKDQGDNDTRLLVEVVIK